MTQCASSRAGLPSRRDYDCSRSMSPYLRRYSANGSLPETRRVPTDGILEAAANNGCDLIVVGSHGRGALGRFLLGSIATDVLVHSHIPVLICR